MCGIAGLCNFKGDIKKNIGRMNDCLRHRGPDAGGVWIAETGELALGHRRLAVVDLTESGAQPMVSHSGRFVIAFNGEIYNYKKIAGQLLGEKKVDRFYGTSDTEVLLEAIESYGLKQTLTMCKGMFAMAVYDKKEQKLFLARDRVGEKPLYYGVVNEAVAFASEIGAIASLDGFANPINAAVLKLYFTHGYIPVPHSIYQGIAKLQPGIIIEIKLPLTGTFHGAIGYSYWSMTAAAAAGQKNPFRGSREEAAAELERLLKASVKEQMVADVPVGAFLSAGIDSSTIVALMQSQAIGRVKSFTIGMAEEGYNEAAYAKEIAAYLGTEHTELYITEQDAKGVIPRLAEMFGEPFADSSQIPTWLVSRMTREHVTVSLSGDGGDELFCGYHSYASVERIWRKTKKVPYFVRKPLSELLLSTPLGKKPAGRVRSRLLGAKDPIGLYLLSQENDPLIGRIALESMQAPSPIEETAFDFLPETSHKLMLADMLMYHPDDILVKVDRTAMAVSLETRVPMLDKDVIEFAWSLPLAFKREGGVGKAVLRDVLYRHVPKAMMERPKKGFSIPIDKWLRQPELREWAEGLIDRDTLKRQGLLDPEVIWRIWEDFTQKGEWRIQIWYVLMFQEWLRREPTLRRQKTPPKSS